MPELTLDHAIIGVEDLRASANALSAVLGRKPSWRGRHPAYGTANVLFRLDSSYLELLAPDPDASSDTAHSAGSGQAWTGSLGRFLRERGGGLFSIALQTADVAATAARAKAKGLPVEDPLAGSGVDLDSGATREWVNARIPPESTRGTRCFFIEHKSPPDALPVVPIEEPGAVLDIVAVSIASQDPAGARGMWREVFGLAEHAAEGEWRFDLGNATLIVAPGGGAGNAPDAYRALHLRVESVDAAASRLRRQGVEPEEVALPGVKAVAVAVCGARMILTEGT